MQTMLTDDANARPFAQKLARFARIAKENYRILVSPAHWPSLSLIQNDFV